MAVSKRLKEYKDCCNRVFNTEDGKRLLVYLKQDHVDRTCFSKDTNETFYKLGQREFVQSLIKFIKDDIDFEKLQSRVEREEINPYEEL
jgi:hypothetical protein